MSLHSKTPHSIETLESRIAPALTGPLSYSLGVANNGFWDAHDIIKPQGLIAGDVVDVTVRYYDLGSRHDLQFAELILDTSIMHPPSSSDPKFLGGREVLGVYDVTFSYTPRADLGSFRFQLYFPDVHYPNTVDFFAEFLDEAAYVTITNHDQSKPFIPVPVPPKPTFDIAVSKLRWDSKLGGLELSYNVTGKEVPGTTAELGLDWASGPNAGDALDYIGDSILQIPISLGKHVYHIEGSSLTFAPDETKNILATIDPDNLLREGNENNSLTNVADVSLAFGANAIGDISNHTVSVIKDLLRQSGTPVGKVTSLYRTPEHQARVMFEDFSTHIPSKRIDYAAAGETVEAVYDKATQGLSKAKIRAQAAAIQALMVAQINLVGPTNVSHHCTDPASLQVLDLAPSSFTKSGKALFVAALAKATVNEDVSKYFTPGQINEKAYHIEVMV